MWHWVARGNTQQISYIPQTEQHLPFGLMLLHLGNVTIHLSLLVASGAFLHLTLGYAPPPTMRSFFTGTRKEGVIAREIVASLYKPPPAFCTEAKVAKGRAYLQDTTVLV